MKILAALIVAISHAFGSTSNISVAVVDVPKTTLSHIIFEYDGNKCSYTVEKQDLVDNQDKVVDKAINGCKNFLEFVIEREKKNKEFGK
jgi:hypothetical protein